LLLHGWGSKGELMMPIAYRLKGYKYIVPDFYGFGNSLHPNYPLELADYANGVLDILKKERVDRAIFICHSFGGRVGCFIASRYKSLVEKLVLCDSAGIKPKRHVNYYIKIWFYRIRKKLGLNTDKCGSTEYRELSPFMKKTFVNVVNYDQKKEIINIDSPTLIVWGKKDKTTPMYMARKFRRLIKNSHLVVLSGAGHFAYADDLDRFINYVKIFLKE